MAHAKFEHHLPLYRLQEELLSTTTMWFNRSVLSNAVIRTGERLLPMWDLIRTQVLDSFYVRADETTGRVLRPGTGKTKVVSSDGNDRLYHPPDLHFYDWMGALIDVVFASAVAAIPVSLIGNAIPGVTRWLRIKAEPYFFQSLLPRCQPYLTNLLRNGVLGKAEP